MENLSLIAAVGLNSELGIDNHLIWKIKEDLMFYRKTTLHQNVIMGRKTFESLPPKALEKRNFFILSSKSLDTYFDINTYNNIENLLEYIELSPQQNFVVAGGSQIYEAFMPYVDTMYLTEIETFAAADKFFPNINMKEWDIETIYHSDINSDIPYVRNKYVRKRVR